MAVKNLPVLFNGDQSNLVGYITLHEQIEEYLRKGQQFNISPIILLDNIVGLDLTFVQVCENKHE